MRKGESDLLRQLSIAVIVTVLLLHPGVASAANEKCADRDEAVMNGCKYIKYKELPLDLKKVMTKMECNVKTGSNYDYGYAVDLNSDGVSEYAFCCQEAAHGPCMMAIFGKSSGKWQALYDGMPGFDDDGETSCYGFTPLKSRHSGYNDVCIDNGAGVIIFKDGKYQDAPDAGN